MKQIKEYLFEVTPEDMFQELEELAHRIGLVDRWELIRRVSNGEYYGKSVEQWVFSNLFLIGDGDELYNWVRHRRDADNNDVLHGRIYG